MNSDLGHSAPGEHGGSYGSTVWIPVRERLPLEQDGEVLVRMPDSRCEIAWATYWHGASNDFAGWCFRDPDEDEAPTHWMPIPPASTGADTARPGSDEQDAPASPAPPQGEREAFEAWLRMKEWFKPHHIYRRDMKGSTRFGQYVCGDVEEAWLAWEARAALSASDKGASALCLHTQPAVSAEAKEMRLCEIGHVVPWPNTPYVFTVDPTCKQCVALAAPYAAMGTPPADNKENGNV